MSRKLYVIWSFVLFVGLMPLFGSASSGGIVQINQVDMWILAKSNIGAISLQPCDGQPLESALEGTLRPNQTTDLCLAFINRSSGDINIEYGFADDTTNADDALVCKENINTGTFFSYVSNYWTSAIVVPANWYAIKRILLRAPKTGDLQWCISYRSLDDALTIKMFNVIYRKTHFINFHVSGKYYGFFDQSKDFIIWLKNNKKFWIGAIIVLWLLFVYTLSRSSSKKHKHKK